MEKKKKVHITPRQPQSMEGGGLKNGESRFLFLVSISLKTKTGLDLNNKKKSFGNDLKQSKY